MARKQRSVEERRGEERRGEEIIGKLREADVALGVQHDSIDVIIVEHSREGEIIGQ